MDRPVDRRTYLATATAAASALALAGCMGTDDSESADESGGDSDGDDPDYPDAAGTYDDFEDLDAWEARVGSLSADEERTYDGSQSAKLSSDGSVDHVRIARELDEPADFSEVVPGVAVTSDVDVAPVVQLLDEEDNRVDYRAPVWADGPFVRQNMGIDHVEGDPDLSAITTIQVVGYVGTGRSATLWVDDLHFVPRVTDGKVMLHLDGGYESHHAEALPVLDEHDLSATAFVTPGRIRESEEADGDRLTEDQLADLDDAGWTIASNGAHGLKLTTMDGYDPEEEIADAADWLEEQGYDAAYFAYPGGGYDEEILEIVEEHHDLAFAGRFPAQGYAANPLLCQRVSDPDAEQARAALDLTAEYGGITPIAFYGLDSGRLSALEETASHLAELADAGEIEVITPADAEEYVY